MQTAQIQMTDETFETFIEYIELIRKTKTSEPWFLMNRMMECEMELMDAGYSQEDLQRLIKAVR